MPPTTTQAPADAPDDPVARDRQRARAQARPFACGTGPRAALLLHGLTGTPYEVRPFARGLYHAGFAVRAPLLPGHDDLARLARTTWRDWADSASAALDRARAGARATLVLGFSMGGLLALRLAALRPEAVDALIVIAAPLALPAWQRPIIRTLAHLRDDPRMARFVPRLLGPRLGDALLAVPKGLPDVRSAREARRNPGLSAFPYTTLRELLDLQREVRRLLPRVRAPTLIVHGRLDHTAPLAQARALAGAIAAPHPRLVVLEQSFHLVGRDLDRDRAVAAVVDFARKTLPEPTAHEGPP